MALHSRVGAALGPWAILALVGLATTGCSIFGGLFGGGSGENAGLRDPVNREVSLVDGTTTASCKIRYEGGANESWAFDQRRCPPEYRAKPQSKDDPPAPEPIAPVAKAPRVVAAVPDWCERYTGWGMGREWAAGSLVTDALARAQSMQEIMDVGEWIAVASCDRMHYRPRQEWVASWLQGWLNKTGMDLDESRRLFAELVGEEHAFAAAGDVACTKGPFLAALACADPKRRVLPTYVQLDALEVGGKLTDRERVAYLVGCSGAHCAIDADAVHWDSVDELVDADTELRSLRFAARVRLTQLRVRMKQELPSPIAKQAFASWHEKVLANDPEIVRMAMKVVASRTAAGPVECPSALAPALTKRMGAIRPATLRAIDAALEDPVTQLSWRALVLCEKDPTTAGLRAAPLTRTKTSWFGPRRAAIAALGIAVERLPTVDEAAANEWGVVASVDKPRDGVVRVHLEGRKWHEPVQRCRETRRIDGISDDGRLIYREICRVVGRTVHRTAPDPLLVDADVAKKLAPGRGIRVRTVNPGSGREWIDGKVVSGTGAPRPAKIESIFTDAKALADGTGVREWLGFELARGS